MTSIALQRSCSVGSPERLRGPAYRRMVKLPLRGLNTQSKRNAREIENLKTKQRPLSTPGTWNKPVNAPLLGRVPPLFDEVSEQICDPVNALVMASRFTWSETMS